MATFTPVGVQAEAALFVDHMEFSSFNSDEDVSRDGKLPDALIAENWRDD